MTSNKLNHNDGPEIIVLGGPNGAGKSTSATALLPQSLSVEQFVNADMIASGLSPFSPTSSALEAGRIMLRRIHQLAEQRISFGFETTLASRSYVSFLRRAQAAGYVVHVIYIWLSRVELALSRVAERVRQGGHDVPSVVVERRYWRGLKNFYSLYMPLADSWTLCDNTEEAPVIIAQGGMNVAIRIIDPAKFDRISRSIADEQ